jgi:hypothetical protein
MRLDAQCYHGPLSLRYSFINNLQSKQQMEFAADFSPKTLLSVNGKAVELAGGFYLDSSILRNFFHGNSLRLLTFTLKYRILIQLNRLVDSLEGAEDEGEHRHSRKKMRGV